MKQIEVLKYLNDERAIYMQDLNKEVLDYIYYNYEDIKDFIKVRSVGRGLIYSLSIKGKRYFEVLSEGS